MEHRIEAGGHDVAQLHRPRKGGFGDGVRFEAPGGFGLRDRVATLRLDGRRLATEWRTQRDFCARLLEDVVRRGKLLQPETRLEPRVVEVLVRGQSHQYLQVEMQRRNVTPDDTSRVHAGLRAGQHSWTHPDRRERRQAPPVLQPCSVGSREPRNRRPETVSYDP